MGEYVIDNKAEAAYARVFFSGDVTRRDVGLAYRELLSRTDLSLLHRFLWDFRRARLGALSDEDLRIMASRTDGGRHPHNGQVIADAIVVARPDDLERMTRWREIAGDLSGVADCVFTDFQEAVVWLLTHPGPEGENTPARADAGKVRRVKPPRAR